MTLQRYTRWIFALAIATVIFVGNATELLAQSRNGFNKSGKGAGRSATAPKSSSPQVRGQHRGNNNGNRGHSRGHHKYGGGYRYVPQGRIGTGHPGSRSHFYGVYLPISPYGNFGYNRFGVSQFGYNRFGYSNYGLIQPYYPVIPQTSVFGFNNPGYNLNPAYSTYGSYLNGGVLSSNTLGSSVAAQALQRSQNQQPIIPLAQNQIGDQQLEMMRLQIELERAKQQIAAAQQGMPAQQTQRSLKIPTTDQQRTNDRAIEQLGFGASA